MKPLPILFLIVGVVLMVFGVRATDSVASSFSEFFTGNPTDRAMWLLLGGIVCLIVGAVMLGRGRRVIDI